MLENGFVLVLVHTLAALLHTHLCQNAQVTALHSEQTPHIVIKRKILLNFSVMLIQVS